MMNSKQTLTKATLIEIMPVPHKPHYRPMTTKVSQESLAKFVDVIKQAGQENLFDDNANEALLDVAASMLAPSTIAIGEADMPVDLSKRRYAFSLELTSSYADIEQIDVVTGFTSDVDQPIVDGVMPRDMRFYINNISIIKSRPSNLLGQEQQSLTTNKSYAVLVDPSRKMSSVGMRPEDIIGWLQTQLMCLGIPTDKITDARSMLADTPKLSDVADLIPANYLGFLRHVDNHCNDFDGDEPQTDPYDHLLWYCRTQPLSMLRFFNELFAAGIRGNSFTFDEFNSIWFTEPGFWKITKPTYVPQMINTENWSDSLTETTIAYTLVHMLRAVLTTLNLNMLYMHISKKADEEPKIMVHDFYCLLRDDPTPTFSLLERIVDTINKYIVKGFLLQKVDSFDIDVNIDLTTYAKLNIRINDGDVTTYAAPMFCDSYYSPMVAPDDQYRQALAINIDFLLQTLALEEQVKTNAPAAPEHQATKTYSLAVKGEPGDDYQQVMVAKPVYDYVRQLEEYIKNPSLSKLLEIYPDRFPNVNKESSEPEAVAFHPELINLKVCDQVLKIGDYVYATKFSDCDPNDPWAVGFISEFKDDRILVTNEDGSEIASVGRRWWRFARPISSDMAKLLLTVLPGLEGQPFNPEEMKGLFSNN